MYLLMNIHEQMYMPMLCDTNYYNTYIFFYYYLNILMKINSNNKKFVKSYLIQLEPTVNKKCNI